MSDTPHTPDTAPHTDSAPTSTAPPVWSAREPEVRPRGPRSSTLVLGLLLALFGGAAIAVGLGVEVDLQLGLIVTLVLAALLLLAVPLLQRSRRAPEADRP